GGVIGRGAGGGANLLSSPDPAGSIGAALAESLAGAIPVAVVLSCSGGDRPADRERGRAILTQLVGPAVRIDVTHDAIAALYAGNPMGCGVVLIAGTGSIAFGRNDEGGERRAGGRDGTAYDRGPGLPRRRRVRIRPFARASGSGRVAPDAPRCRGRARARGARDGRRAARHASRVGRVMERQTESRNPRARG